jgi:hypothetical protein
MYRAFTIGFLALTSPVAALAADAANCGVDLHVRFIEGAPVDRFVISNGSDQAYPLTEVAFDLTASKGRLIFDTQNGGSGVEVFQPFVSTIADIDVRDGATGLRIPMDGLAAGTDVSFTIDVDDQLTASELGQIRVSGSEMAGAQVVFAMNGQPFLATFNGQNVARIMPTCDDNA